MKNRIKRYEVKGLPKATNDAIKACYREASNIGMRIFPHEGSGMSCKYTKDLVNGQVIEIWGMYVGSVCVLPLDTKRTSIKSW